MIHASEQWGVGGTRLAESKWNEIDRRMGLNGEGKTGMGWEVGYGTADKEREVPVSRMRK